MNFELDEDQAFLRDGLRAFLEQAVPLSRVRASRVDGFDEKDGTWELIGEAGWTGLAGSEAAGGAGLGFEEAMIMAMEAGRSLLHVPLTESIVAIRALERHGSAPAHADLVEALVAGRAAITLALGAGGAEHHDEAEHQARAEVGARAERGSEGWLLSGAVPVVSFGPLTDACLLDVVVPGEGRALLLASGDRLEDRWSRRELMDRTVPRYDLSLEGLALDAEAAVATFAPEAPEIEEMLDEWRVLLAAENEGACRRLLEMTSRYVVEREQFGRPVGANQAVKTRMAEMGASVERMRAAIYNAAMSIERRSQDRPLAVAMAKHAAGVGASFVGTQAIHLHGALGFTWEQDVHLYAKRMKTNELLLGGERECLARIARAVLDE